MKIAIPTAEGLLCPHFGHCQQFHIVEVDTETNTITKTESLTPPPHEPGVYPNWLSQMGCGHIIAGGMGGRAIDMFRQYGIQVVIGAPSKKPETIIAEYLNGTLFTGANPCDDSGSHKGNHKNCANK